MNPPKLSYIICTQPRSGSWLLAEGLESTKVAGRPREYFNPLTEEKFFKLWSLSSFEEYFFKFRSMATTKNGVFGLKLHWSEYQPMLDKLKTISSSKGLSDLDLLNFAFPNLVFIWLSRRDRIRQAVSHYRAVQTGQWWNIPSENSNPIVIPDKIDHAAIAHLERFAVSTDAKWANFFESTGVTPLPLFYEDLAASFDSTISDIVHWLDASCVNHTVARPRLVKQADELTEQWVAEYREYKLNIEGSRIDGRT